MASIRQEAAHMFSTCKRIITWPPEDGIQREPVQPQLQEKNYPTPRYAVSGKI